MLSSGSFWLPKHVGHDPITPRTSLCSPVPRLPCSLTHPVTSVLQIPLFSSNEEIILIKEIKNVFALEF